PRRRAAVPSVAASQRVDYYTGAVSAAVGVIPFIVAPLSVSHDAPRLQAALAELPPPPDPNVCPLLLDAERALERGAHDERLARSWWAHGANLAFNTGVLLFLGLGYQHWLPGLINGGAGLAVG